MKKGYDMDHMVKVVDEESGIVIAMLDVDGVKLSEMAKLAWTIGEAYGCNEVTMFYGDKSLKVKVSEGCT